MTDLGCMSSRIGGFILSPWRSHWTVWPVLATVAANIGKGLVSDNTVDVGGLSALEEGAGNTRLEMIDRSGSLLLSQTKSLI